MHKQSPNPYAHDSAEDRPMQGQPADFNSCSAQPNGQGQVRRAVKTMVTTVIIMATTLVAFSAIILIESSIKGEPIGSFWAELREESWIALLFVSVLPTISTNRNNKQGRCSLSSVFRKRTAIAGNATKT